MQLFLASDWIVHHLRALEPVAKLQYFGINKHVIAMMIAAAMLLLVFVPFGRAVQRDVVPRGRLVNLLESMLLFLRDEVCRPVLGKEGDRFLPVVWTFFFFILFCNLMGLVPIPVKIPLLDASGAVHWAWFGNVTPTGQAWVTGTLATIAFIWYHGLGIKKQGLVAYLRHVVPGGVPMVLAPFLFFLEIVSHFIKAAALCIRLWANMLGGHAVLFAFIGFIFTFGVWMAPVSIVAGVAIYFLEIFVAFLQAFVFTFLVVIFLGGALHPH